jgi:uncharacterized repeat protein (TIGR03803 family)
MKTWIKNTFRLCLLAAVLGSVPVGQLLAQTFTTLHSFTATPAAPFTNSDGANPSAAVVLLGSTLYGTTFDGGSGGGAGQLGRGTLFAVRTDGTGFTNLHDFSPDTGGAHPAAGLLLSGTRLYGTTVIGGDSNFGTVFAIDTDGTGFTTLYSFSGATDGRDPLAGLILSGDTLYGTAQVYQGNWGGSIFALDSNATSFAAVYNFSDSQAGSLTLSGNTLYGMSSGGGSTNGTVFSVNTDGTGFATLHTFSGSDGAGPLGGLVLSSNTLYGTTRNGGVSDSGTVFAINTDGTGFTNLYSFAAMSASSPYTNIDGAFPSASLILSGDTLYGTARYGGSAGNGTIFAINADGTNFKLLHSFTATSGPSGKNLDGANPFSSLFLANNTLYGTAEYGGNAGTGTVFSISLESSTPPQLAITLSGPNVILTWPTNFTGFALQSTANLTSPVAWTGVPASPIIMNGQNTVTDPILGAQQFYRLSH